MAQVSHNGDLPLKLLYSPLGIPEPFRCYTSFPFSSVPCISPFHYLCSKLSVFFNKVKISEEHVNFW